MKTIKTILLITLFLLQGTAAHAWESRSVTFSLNDFSMQLNDSIFEVSINPNADGYDYEPAETGEPSLICRFCELEIPYGINKFSYRISNVNMRLLYSNVYMKAEKVYIQPEESMITDSGDSLTDNNLWNEQLTTQSVMDPVEFCITGNRDEKTVAIFITRPFLYDADRHEVYFVDSLTIEITGIDRGVPQYSWTTLTNDLTTMETSTNLFYAVIFRAYNWIVSGELNTEASVMTDYGFRIADSKIYVCYYRRWSETVAFDFTLGVGDSWTTLNGMEWTVTGVSDTTLYYTVSGDSDAYHCKKLDVISSDGKFTDLWLEGIGSVHYHLLLDELSESKSSHLLYYNFSVKDCMPYKIISFDFEEDPIYGGCLGRPVETDARESNVSYKDGTIEIEHRSDALTQYMWYYYDAYRKDENVYVKYLTFDTMEDGEQPNLMLKYSIGGLPTSMQQPYTVQINGEDFITTSIRNVQTTPEIRIDATDVYNLNGQRLQGVPQKGMYILNGKKNVNANR